jgi:SAM-dependent methyltransferase
MRAVSRLALPANARILDVGCGSGKLLLDLRYLGFSNLTGVDPYLEGDLDYADGPKVFKRELGQMEGRYDLIMLHHCFEHMERPAQVFKQLSRLLSESGMILIRIPVADSYGWRHYGINWFHLDAPRHLFLHTSKTIQLLAQGGGLRVTEVIQEANEGTFWSSEAYEKDIPLADPRFPFSSPLKKFLGWRLIRDYKTHAEELNRSKEADWRCFHLRKD